MQDKPETKENLNFIQMQLEELLREKAVITPELQKLEGINENVIVNKPADVLIEISQENRIKDLIQRKQELEDRKSLLEIEEIRLLEKLGKLRSAEAALDEQKILAKLADRLEDVLKVGGVVRKLTRLTLKFEDIST